MAGLLRCAAFVLLGLVCATSLSAGVAQGAAATPERERAAAARAFPWAPVLLCVRFCPPAARGAQFVAKKVKGPKAIQITQATQRQLVRTWRKSAGSRGTAQRRLTSNIEQATRTRKASHEFAHHIVAYSARHARFAQQVLQRCGVGPNDAANGVFMTKHFHAHLHTKAYYENINRLMLEYAVDCGPVGAWGGIGKPPIRDALQQIATELRHGRFPH